MCVCVCVFLFFVVVFLGGGGCFLFLFYVIVDVWQNFQLGSRGGGGMQKFAAVCVLPC